MSDDYSYYHELYKDFDNDPYRAPAARCMADRSCHITDAYSAEYLEAEHEHDETPAPEQITRGEQLRRLCYAERNGDHMRDSLANAWARIGVSRLVEDEDDF